MTEVVGHFLVFTIAAIGFLIAPLLIGRLVRPPPAKSRKGRHLRMWRTDHRYQLHSIRSSPSTWSPLLFIIFDVEVVFFFPWAAVFGNAMQLADSALSADARLKLSEQLLSMTPGDVGTRSGDHRGIGAQAGVDEFRGCGPSFSACCWSASPMSGSVATLTGFDPRQPPRKKSELVRQRCRRPNPLRENPMR